ncbi:uncharacterized protein LOC119336912 isoform X1 [Triticum dicoccoides]|uniref:uncharacterized protein LOC119336912 isoform X1 n=1 Tax=Triticum dicoccoides TaxID=85692 RepID=UPI0018917167|nr:uncharacterized protein LOC119336912 isoform X1 [Triticum dicoccoides]
MVRNVPDPDSDDFMPPRAQHAGGDNRNAKKQKAARNRGSHERLTELYRDFDDAQKEAAKEMGMQSPMNIKCTNLNSPMCDWFARLYHPQKREFVIPGRGRILLDEESVFNTLGVPNGGMDVPYKVDTKVQVRLFPEMFLGLMALPANSAFANMIGAMQTSDDDFKRKLLMYLISNVFAPTTLLRPSSRCFPVPD